MDHDNAHPRAVTGPVGTDGQRGGGQQTTRRPDYLAEGLALEAAVQDLLQDAAGSGRIPASTSGVALIRALATKPAVVRVAGNLTVRGQRIGDALVKAGRRRSAARPRVGGRHV